VARRSKTARFRARQNDGDDNGDRPAAPSTGAKRPSSSRSRGQASRGQASRETGTAQPRIGRDGKVQIACPACAAEYRIMPENMDSKVKCSQCHRVFFPGAATGGKRTAQRKNPATPIIAFGAAVIIIVLIGVLIANAGEEPKPKPVEEPKVVSLGNSTPQVKAVKRWATIRSKKRARSFTVRNTSGRRLMRGPPASGVR